jgi:hypothetical protein
MQDSHDFVLFPAMQKLVGAGLAFELQNLLHPDPMVAMLTSDDRK